jgi:hypothetical protein
MWASGACCAGAFCPFSCASAPHPTKPPDMASGIALLLFTKSLSLLPPLGQLCRKAPGASTPWALPCRSCEQANAVVKQVSGKLYMQQLASVQYCGTHGVNLVPHLHYKHDTTAQPVRFLWRALPGHCRSCRQILPAVVSRRMPWRSPEPPRQSLSCATQ